MTTPVEEMEEESLKALTRMFGSREEAIKHYDEMVEKQKADDIAWAATQYQRDRKGSYPPLEDVIVALAEKAEGDSTMWDGISGIRKAIKKLNPKP